MTTKFAIACVLFGLTAAGSAREPAARLQVPPGFVVEKVAGPPLVRYPLFACFDDRGRLYVAEGTGKSVPGGELVKLNLGKITLLEDTDGDGKFDKSTTFADNLVFPQGVLWHDGAVYCASHPSIWKFEDTDGDGKADRRQELIKGFNFNGNGCDIHGPFLGPDGRLYWTDGRHGYKVDTKEGKCLEGLASRIWRCRPDGTEIERLCGGGFDNPVELAWTPDGEMIGTMDQGPGDCLLHYVEGGVYPMEHPSIKEFPRTGPLLGAVKKYSVELPAALCGTMRYRGTALGPRYDNALFTAHYMTHKVVKSELIRDGSTFRAEDTDFLVSADPYLRLTDVLEDADGSLLVVDMGGWFTYGFLGNVVPRPEMLGAIYRIRPADVTKTPDPWGVKLKLGKRSAKELLAFLDDPRAAVRDQAVERLAKLGAAAELESVLRSAQRSVEARRNAVWALCRIDGPKARAAARRALDDRDRTVRAAAAHAAGLHRDPEATDALEALVKIGDAPLRRKAAEALGRIGRAEAVPMLLAMLRRPCDPFLEHSLIYALIQINDRATTLKGLEHSDPRLRRAALIALDQMKDGNLTQEEVVALLDDADAAVQLTALEVIGRRPAWASTAQQVVHRWLKDPRLTASQESALYNLLLAGSGEAGIQQVVAKAMTSPKTVTANRLLVVRVAERARLDPLPKSWVAGLSQFLTGPDAELRRSVLAAAKTRNWRHFDDYLREMSKEPKQSAELRLAALECLAGRGKLDAEAFAFLTSHLAETAEPLLRMSAVRTLAASALTNEQLADLAGKTGEANTMTLRMLLPLFSKSGDVKVGAALVKSLGRSPGTEALTVGELDHALKGFAPEVRKNAERLREKLLAREKGQAQYLTELSAELEKLSGDADAGKEVFLSKKATCYACHRAAGRGGTIGPDLHKIGGFRTRAELLQSIIFPSLTITPEYRSVTVTARDGRVVTGRIMLETADALFLRTPDLAEVRIPRNNVEELAPASVSLMPDGLERTLTRRELRDLLEFLVRQK